MCFEKILGTIDSSYRGEVRACVINNTDGAFDIADGDRICQLAIRRAEKVNLVQKETDVKKEDIDFPSWLYFDLTQWVSHDTATDKEKKEHKNEIKIFGGFLKTLAYKEAFRLAWSKAEFSERKKLFSLPNWNNEIFMQISGIDAEKEIAEEEK